MTESSQPNLLDIGPPGVVEFWIRDGWVRYEHKGRRIEGIVKLRQSNPRSRRNCRIDLRVPPSWKPGTAEAVIRIAAHWFRDIGGLRSITSRQACHIARRLHEVDALPEREIHSAINLYARTPMCVQHKSWKAIGVWFMGTDLDTWADRADDRKRQADIANAKQPVLVEAAATRQADAKTQRQAREEAISREREAIRRQAQDAAESKRRQAEADRDQRAAEQQAQLATERESFHQLAESVRQAAFERASKLFQKHPNAGSAAESNPRFAATLYMYGRIEATNAESEADA